MAKTYSVAFQRGEDGIWITNWHEFNSLDDIDFEQVAEHCLKHNMKAYGYYYGEHSSKLTSARCRTVLKTWNNEIKDIENPEVIKRILAEKNTHFTGENITKLHLDKRE